MTKKWGQYWSTTKPGKCTVLCRISANQARLFRIKDKTHPHNKLTKVTITDPYQTTAVLAAEDQLEKASREAVQVMSQKLLPSHKDRMTWSNLKEHMAQSKKMNNRNNSIVIRDQ